MIIEALTFKLALDFTKYLRKNRIYLADVKLDFFDRSRHEYSDFLDLAAMQAYYDQNYVPLDNCLLGSLVGIQFFRSTSDTYDFPTSYKAVDVLGNVTVSPGAGFDLQRNDQRTVLKDRQLTLLRNTIGEYLKFYNELKFIYVTGIYSPCYAEPGWSENTWWLRSLRETLVSSNNQSSFPYTNTVIQTKPPVS
jgi:hypothetical protein